MIPGVNVIGGKVNVESVNGAGWSGGVLRPNQGFCECKYIYTVLKLRVKQVIYESKT